LRSTVEVGLAVWAPCRLRPDVLGTSRASLQVRCRLGGVMYGIRRQRDLKGKTGERCTYWTLGPPVPSMENRQMPGWSVGHDRPMARSRQKTEPDAAACPCEFGLPYGECCGRWLRSTTGAPAAEQVVANRPASVLRTCSAAVCNTGLRANNAGPGVGLACPSSPLKRPPASSTMSDVAA
jgi:hypothetical protein